MAVLGKINVLLNCLRSLKMKNKYHGGWKYIPVFLMMIILCGLVLSCSEEEPSQTETFTFVYTCQDPAEGFQAKFSEKMFDEIEKKTGGRIQFESHYGGELAPSFNEAYQAVIQGIVDIGFVSPIEVPGQFELNSLITFSDWSVRSKRSQVWTEIYNEFSEIRDEWKQVKVICLASFSEGPIGSRIPFRTLEDCQGHKFVGAGEILSEKLSALGFVPVTVNPADTFMSIQTGLVDGVNIGWFYWRDFGLYQVLPYVTRVPLSQYPFAWVMNLDTWNKLPSDLQDTINDMFESGYFAKLYDDMIWTEEEAIRSVAPSEYNATIIELSADETARWEKAVDEVAEKWVADLEAKGLPGRKVLDKVYELENKYAIVKMD
jgi:TRAP-type C4-dicarboxylate transport system substrate-binding protein